MSTAWYGKPTLSSWQYHVDTDHSVSSKKHASANNYTELSVGGPQSVHACLLFLVDDNLAGVGIVNLDNRSLTVNFKATTLIARGIRQPSPLL